jgi:two-component system, cell cycle sensor histidine kinase and response regulator CckA
VSLGKSLIAPNSGKEEVLTERGQEELIAEAEVLYRTLFQQSPDGILIMDEQGGFLHFNEAAHLQLGYTREEFKQLNIIDLDPFASAEGVRASLKRALAEGGGDFEVNHRTKQGELRNVQIITRVIYLSGRPVFQTIWRDITERRRHEEELQKAKRLESIGLLAGGIAHDFNNILTSILGNISLARTSMRPEGETAQILAQAEQATIRAKGLSRQLLTFARGGEPVKKQVMLPELVKEAVDLTLSGTPVRSDYVFAPDPWPVEADDNQLNQVIGNLVINAVQAMPKGGVLRVTVTNEVVQEGSDTELPAGRYGRISIKDHGAGIAVEHLTKIFDPYFTTKENGNGLGLAISYSIVRRHGGRIEVDSTPGQGSTFTILLPASERRAIVPRDNEANIIPGRGRILVMDDDQMVLKVATRMLERLGYQVTGVSDGIEAVEVYRQSSTTGEPFRAVILDLTVPAGVGGGEAACKILELDPGARIIVSSGYADDPIMANHATHGFKAVVPKPYDLVELSVTMQRVLAG